MGQIERHTASCYLGCVNAITAHTGRCVCHGNHFTARLHQLEADHQSHVTGTQHQHTLARQCAVEVHHGLRCTCADDTRQRPARKRDHVLACAGGNQNRVPLDVDYMVFDLDSHFLFRKNADHDGIQNNLNPQRCCLCQKLFTDMEASNLCLVLFRAKELVNLLKQLSAGLCVFIVYHNVHSLFCRLNGCGQACRPCADHNHIITLHHFAAPPGCSAVTPYCVRISMPSSSGVIHVRTFGCPLTTMTQSVQRPMAQKIPLGLCSFLV